MVIFIMVDRIEVAKNPQADKERDGFYMITNITNVHEDDNYMQMITMTKGGLSKSYDRVLFSEGGE